jgi:hypothetical protein
MNSFQMNAMPWQNYGDGNIGLQDFAAFNSAGVEVWKTTVDLREYTDWATRLTVNVRVNEVSSLTFYSPYNSHGNDFWPSIDKIIKHLGCLASP